jgi:hypothetical protein
MGEHPALESTESRLEIGARKKRNGRTPLQIVQLGGDLDGRP